MFKNKKIRRTTLQFEGKSQILEDILFTPFEKIQCQFGHFTKWESFDAISDTKGKIQRFIRLLKDDVQPTAYEFHDFETGHCYVDYIERVGMTAKEGYTKIPLFKSRL